MSTIYYGGISLNLARILRFDQRAVYSEDGTDYLHTHFYLSCLVAWNPKVNANFLLQPDGNLGGPSPVNSIATLRHWLLQPRRLLIVTLGTDILLKSPKDFLVNVNLNTTVLTDGLTPGQTTAAQVPAGAQIVNDPPPVAVTAPCDSKNGPHPISFDQVSIHGAKTLLYKFDIETWLYEPCDVQYIASNRWTQRHTYDFEHMLTRRVTTGTAVFHMDAVAMAADGAGNLVNAWPDDFREQLMIAIPPNFTRTGVDILVTEDGSNLKYTLTDEEQTLNLGPNNPITKIEGWYDWGVSGTGEKLDVGWITGDFVLEGVKHLPLIGRTVDALVRRVSYNLPRFDRQLNIAVWGRKNTPRQVLVDTAFSAATAYGFQIDTQSINSVLEYVLWSSVSVRVNIIKKYAQLSFNWSQDLATIALYQTGQALVALRAPIIKVGIGPQMGTLPDNLQGRAFGGGLPFNAVTASVGNPPPPYSNASRGYYLGSLVAQVFAQSGTKVTVDQVPASERQMTDRS